MTTKAKIAIELLKKSLIDCRAAGVSHAQAIDAVRQVYEAPTVAAAVAATAPKKTKGAKAKPAAAPATKPVKSVNTLKNADGRILEFRILNGDALLGSYLEGRGANVQKLDRDTARQFYRQALNTGFKACDRDPKAQKAIDDILSDVAKKRARG